MSILWNNAPQKALIVYQELLEFTKMCADICTDKAWQNEAKKVLKTVDEINKLSEDKMKTAPFDLSTALAGKPCVTRAGRKVLEIKQFNIERGIAFTIQGGNGEVYFVHEDGFMFSTRKGYLGSESDFDLFMLVVPQVYCIGIGFAEIKEDNIHIGYHAGQAYKKEYFKENFQNVPFKKVIEFTLDENEPEFREVEK